MTSDGDMQNVGTMQAQDPAGLSKQVRFIPLDADHSRLEGVAVGLVRRCRNLLPIAFVFLADVIALTVSGSVALWLGGPVVPIAPVVPVYPLFVAFLVAVLSAYLLGGLYANETQSGPEELRKLTLMTTVAVAGLALVIYVVLILYRVPPLTFGSVWLFLLFAVPMARFAVRRLLSSFDWWGRKAIIVSVDPQAAQRLVDALRTDRGFGIRPCGILSVRRDAFISNNQEVAALHGAESVLHYARAHGIDYAIVTSTAWDDPEVSEIIQDYEEYFKHWLIMPDMDRSYSLWVRTRDLNGRLGLEVANKLNRPGERFVKRLLDLLITVTGVLAISPLLLLIALAIKLDSRGAILYGQQRLGRNGKQFRVLKFRSMRHNADALLEAYLQKHPELRAEWEATQKLKDDPRVTRLGDLLRRTSLDELPQLFNVLRGEMSLVGPRPIVKDEVERYGRVWDLYKRTRPGITGHWQVSGRSNTSYDERTGMDAYYVRNWSVWLDLYILFKTPAVVLSRDGAY